MSAKANAMCNPWFAQCMCNQIPDGKGGCTGGKNTANCPPGVCFDTPPGGKVIGICASANKCEGTGTEKGGIGDMKGFMDMMKSIMDMLKPKDSPPSTPPPTTPPGSTCPSGGVADATGKCGCTAYYQVTTPSTDPCAYYVPPISNSLLTAPTSTASDALLNALNSGAGSSLTDAFGGTPANVSDQILSNTTTDTSGGTGDTSTTVNTNQNVTTLPLKNVGGLATDMQSGTKGNIVMTNSGATVLANARDTAGNTEIAGFYGGDTMGTSQPTGLVADLCHGRPWAGSVVSFVIPPAFFDSLCAWRGYDVGRPAPPSAPVTQTVIVQQKTPTSAAPAPAQPAASTVEPEADIWAVPASVPLGSRTSVFWNTQGVVSCKETSPDGSFNENSLSGGASTVPLTGSTVFSISCLTADGRHVTDSVTVDLTI